MDLKVAVAVVILLLTFAIGFGIYKMTGNAVQVEDSDIVKIETNYGDIVVELYPEKAPITVGNFKQYVNENFYSDTIFHRVIDGFMIQGGGVDAKTGREKETHAEIKLESNNGLKNDRGTIAMARTMVPDSATSQFFINTKNNDFLNYGYRDEGYAVFGKVVSGMDVVDKISKVSVDGDDKPVKNVIIKRVVFVE
jgi:cyclophilin family peptidyl-prolyl cis-trans isomerase